MGAKADISKETKEKCLELYALVWPYTKIATCVGLERRQVAKIIKQHEEAERLREAARARRDLAAAYLKEHIEGIQMAGFHLLELTLPPYLRSSLICLPTDLESELQSWLEGTFLLKKGYIPVMGHTVERDYPETRRLVDARVAKREAAESIQSLKEHLPSLWQCVDKWNRTAERYNTEMTELVREVRQLATDLGISNQQIEPGIQAVMGRIHENGALNDEAPLPVEFDRRGGSTQLARQILKTIPIRQRLKRLTPCLHELDNIFRQTEEILSPSTLRRALITGHCRLCPVP